MAKSLWRIGRTASVRTLLALASLAGCSDEDDPPPPTPASPIDLGGCITLPTDATVVEDPAHLTVRGFAPVGTSRVELQAKDLSGGAYVTFATGQIDATSSLQSCSGSSRWARWSVSAALPADRRYYQAAGPDNAVLIRAAVFDQKGNADGNAATFATNAPSCVQEDVSECIRDPVDTGAEPASPDLTLIVRCGATQGPCCAPWDFAHQSPLEYGEACSGADLATCDSCADPGALCDGDFVCKTGLWPSDTSPYTGNITDPPEEISEDWTYDVQGLATDGAYWYLTQGSAGVLGVAGALYKVPVGANLDVNLLPGNSQAPVVSVKSMPDPYCFHWGDPEIFNGRVYVPMEDCADNENRMMEVDASSLKPLGTFVLEPDIKAPSVAIHPSTGEFFMAGPYDGNTNTTLLRVYEVQPSSGDTPFTMTRDREVAVVENDGVTPFPLNTVQGLAISPSGKLYVSAQASNQTIYCMQLAPDKATLMYRVPVEMHEDLHQEYEGMAVFDMGPNLGQIHLFTYQNAYVVSHGAWFKHVAVPNLGAHPNWL